MNWLGATFVFLIMMSGAIVPGRVAHAACAVGSVSVSAAGGTFSCVNAYNGPKLVPHAASSNDCPADTLPVSVPVGMMCQKTLVSGTELVLRPDERCPQGYRRFVDLDGAIACQSQDASGVTAVAWPKCGNGAIPLITTSGEQCRGAVASVATAAASAQCPGNAYLALDAQNNPICVEH